MHHSLRRLLIGGVTVMAFVAATLAAGCNRIFGIHEGTPRPICADELMIDDMEDGDGSICQSSGRNGGWYTVGDLTSTDLTPGPDFSPTRIDDGTRGTSRYAARFTGSGFTKWGALMGFDLNVQGLASKTYDVSTIAGIKFWMKSNAPVGVEFLTPETLLLADGGECDDASDRNCNHHLVFPVTAPGSGWVEYEVPFDALRQLPAGSARWNKRNLLGIQFTVPPVATFDVWVDDIRFFYSCPTAGCVPTCTDPAFPVRCPANDRGPASCRPPGTDCAAVETWCADPLLIDDMEDGDFAICDSGGRRGWWYASGDGTPNAELTPREGVDFLQTAIPGGRGTSHQAARLAGTGFTDFGALMGFGLNTPQAYDAGPHSGIRFSMKNNVPTMVLLFTVETALPIEGGQCADGPGEHNCENWFSFKITAPSSDWVEHEVPFSAFSQTAGTAAWDPSHLLNINFAPQRDTTFDVWVDDVQFYDCSASPCLPTCTDPAFPVRCPANAQSPAGCRAPGTDCAAYVLGCGASNTTVAPASGVIATFTGAGGGTDILGDIVAVGDPAPTYTTEGTLHITLNAPATSTKQSLLIVDRFQDCIDAGAFTGVQFSIGGSLSGCTLRYFTEDSVHLYDDGDQMSHASHGIGRPGVLAPFESLAPGQITPAPQTVRVPFGAVSGGVPARPIDSAKVTGVAWAFSIDASTAAGTPPCIADLTIDDVQFY